MARGVEEGDLLAVQLDAVCADMLRDAARLAFDDVRLADVVQQRGLAVVHVSHDRHDRRTRHEVLLLVLVVVGDGLLNLHGNEFDLVAELLGHDHERLGVETLVDRHHQSEVHAGRDDFGGRDVHHRGQLAHGDELGDFERRTLLFRTFELLAHAFGHGFALLLAVFRRLGLGALGRQTGQGVLHLLRNLFVAHFGADDRFGRVLVLVAASFARTGLVLLSAAVAVLPAAGTAAAVAALAALTLLAAALRAAFLGLRNVHLLLLEAFALVFAAGDEARHVHRAEHLRTREGHRCRAEDVVFRRLLLRRFGLGRFGCRSGGRSRLLRGFGLCRRGGRGCRGRGFRLLPCGSGCCLCRSRGRCRGALLGLCRRGGLRLRGGNLRLRGRGLGRRGRSGLGFGREVDLAENLHLRDLVLHADHVAFDDDLLFLLALLLLSLLECDGRLLQGDAFADRVACARGGAVRPELLLQNGISLRIDQRIGRSVALDALLVQEVRDGVDTHVELLGNLNEP